MTIFEDTVFLCGQCRKSSGDGHLVSIRYSNSGGWSPKWEGRLCEHLTVADVMNHLGIAPAVTRARRLNPPPVAGIAPADSTESSRAIPPASATGHPVPLLELVWVWHKRYPGCWLRTDSDITTIEAFREAKSLQPQGGMWWRTHHLIRHLGGNV